MKQDVTNNQHSPARLRWVLLSLILCGLILSMFPPVARADTGDYSYRVVFVAPDDTLNVRSGPGASNPVAGELASDARGIRITGEGQMVGETSWYPIDASGLTGWVAGRYLTRDVAPEAFCESAPTDLLDALNKAITERDGELLATLVDEERGLQLFLDSWGQGIRISAKQLRTIFTDPAQSTWGLDPDMTPVEKGTFADNVLPILERDLLHPTTVACNAMNHPEASGPHMLPQGCEGINFYGFFRSPGPDENELDWGEWVVGFEYQGDRPVLSYLAHYHWEP